MRWKPKTQGTKPNDPTRVEAGENPTYLRSDGLGEPDALVGAAEETGAMLIDMSDQLCVDEICPAVIGGVLVYSDHNHLTKVYSRSLAPALARRIDSAAHTAPMP